VSVDSEILRFTAPDVTLYIYVREELGWNLGRETSSPDIYFHSTIIRVDHYRFLAHSF
jgi:hypothetical protein